jgi:chromosome segregation ATPase
MNAGQLQAMLNRAVAQAVTAATAPLRADIQALRKENRELREENRALKQQVQALNNENRDLRADIQALRNENRDLRVSPQVQALSQRVEELSAQNLRLTQRLNYQEAMLVVRNSLDNPRLSVDQHTLLKGKTHAFSTSIHSRNDDRRRRVRRKLLDTEEARLGGDKANEVGSDVGNRTLHAMLKALESVNNSHVSRRSRHAPALANTATTRQRGQRGQRRSPRGHGRKR